MRLHRMVLAALGLLVVLGVGAASASATTIDPAPSHIVATLSSPTADLSTRGGTLSCTSSQLTAHILSDGTIDSFSQADFSGCTTPLGPSTVTTDLTTWTGNVTYVGVPPQDGTIEVDGVVANVNVPSAGCNIAATGNVGPEGTTVTNGSPSSIQLSSAPGLTATGDVFPCTLTNGPATYTATYSVVTDDGQDVTVGP